MYDYILYYKFLIHAVFFVCIFASSGLSAIFFFNINIIKNCLTIKNITVQESTTSSKAQVDKTHIKMMSPRKIKIDLEGCGLVMFVQIITSGQTTAVIFWEFAELSW